MPPVSVSFSMYVWVKGTVLSSFWELHTQLNKEDLWVCNEHCRQCLYVYTGHHTRPKEDAGLWGRCRRSLGQQMLSSYFYLNIGNTIGRQEEWTDLSDFMDTDPLSHNKTLIWSIIYVYMLKHLQTLNLVEQERLFLSLLLLTPNSPNR